MNILIQFEDSFGTCELFRRYNKDIKGCNVKIASAISSPNILILSRREALEEKFDYVVIVFDLDPINDKYALDGKKLKELLRKWMLDKSFSMKPLYKERVILIPNMYCYETLYMYSYIFRNAIEAYKYSDIEVDHKIVALYKMYYNYSQINPESLFNIENRVDEIRSIIKPLKSVSGDWTVQKFHQAYAEQVLRSLFRNVSHSKKYNKIFIKKEDRMFDAIDELEPDYTSKQLIDSIVDGMGKYSIHNRRLYNLLKAKDASDIIDMVLTDESLDELCKELDEYQASIQGLKRDICDLITNETLNADNVFNKLKILK